MQKTALTYWSGFALWALLLAGTVTTALWLEGRDAQRLVRWELLRLAGLSLLLLAGLAAGTGAGLLLAGVVYGLLNLVFLFLLGRGPAIAGQARAH